MEILPYTNEYSVGFNNGKAWKQDVWANLNDTSESEREFSRRLESELRAAKSSSDMSSVEVLLPAELLSRIARGALDLAEQEPRGARGALVVVELAGRRLTSFQLEPGALCTHELHLHLQHDATSWKNAIPQFFKNLTRGNTIIISSQYNLSKKKLYRSNATE